MQQEKHYQEVTGGAVRNTRCVCGNISGTWGCEQSSRHFANQAVRKTVEQVNPTPNTHSSAASPAAAPSARERLGGQRLVRVTNRIGEASTSR